ncbi:7-deoxyloganetic acid glucosyltransferase-like [Olea europaea var. sylvestris]|uniref:7-deoxyloganetic acid glucosyltransferase-like n=1 Tax=Olea europaea var. sylvestris TaxID=158386 RepID=UPI000C1CCD47|nr:7-deoxyloganetic acid glucosyltransferase-like [Olea europaea var. sylvestris]
MASQGAILPPHVLIFPLPVQGHVTSMLKLAELLCLSGLDITFMVSDFSYNRLLKHTTVVSRFKQYPGFHFQSITDGLPDDHPRVGEQVVDILTSTKNITGPLFKQMMSEKNLFGSGTRRPISCIIADGVLTFAGDFAEEKGIPLIYFRTISSCSFWASFCIPELIEAGEIFVQGIGMDQLVKSIPGMEGFLRFRDLPSFCRVNDIYEPNLQLMKSVTRQTTRAQAAIFNTFEDLEGSIVSHIQKHIPKVFTIGPNHSHLKSRLAEKKVDNSVLSGSFWAEDRSCLDWLNAQPSNSVIYVSFGSITVVTREQLLEFWHGLVNSGQRFLWVMRPDSIVGEDGKNQTPIELEEGTKARGYMVGWAPQEEVLNHEAVGGFLTHSGWNSTLESIVVGVPMICWPYFGDQTTNSRFVSEVWKIGLDIKDTCDREIIEKAVRELMEERKDEFLERSENMAKLARKAVSEGGSSYSNLNALIDYIKTMII